jgi:hypothetical protein
MPCKSNRCIGAGACMQTQPYPTAMHLVSNQLLLLHAMLMPVGLKPASELLSYHTHSSSHSVADLPQGISNLFLPLQPHPILRDPISNK